MRQSEYTTFYERHGNVKIPVRGKLFMRHRGRAIYVRNRKLTDAMTGLILPIRLVELSKDDVKRKLDEMWDGIIKIHKELEATEWRSKRDGVITINGKVINTEAAVKCIPY